MADDAIAVGDVVVLKSGSPDMTVSAIMSKTAICQWFVGTDDKSGSFPLAALKRVRQDAA